MRALLLRIIFAVIKKNKKNRQSRHRQSRRRPSRHRQSRHRRAACCCLLLGVSACCGGLLRAVRCLLLLPLRCCCLRAAACAAVCRCVPLSRFSCCFGFAAGCCGLRTACCELLRAAILRAVSCYKVLAMPSVQPLAARSRLVPAIWKTWFGRDSNTRLIQIPRRLRRPWDCHQDMSHETKYKMLKPPARNLTSYLRFSVASCQQLKNMVGTPRQCYFCEN